MSTEMGDDLDRRRADEQLGFAAALTAAADATCGLFSADGAGVMLLDGDHAMRYVGATTTVAAAFEAAQESCGQGPCVESLVDDRVVWSSDLSTDPRWPELRALLADLQIRAVLGVPLHIGGTVVGSLNAYLAVPHEWTDRDMSAIAAQGRVVEQLIGAAMLAEERNEIVDQLTQALKSRVTIERAVGIVMATHDLDPIRAFDHLRRLARSSRRKVADVANDILASPRFRVSVEAPSDQLGEVG